jgi:hypothetical protein
LEGDLAVSTPATSIRSTANDEGAVEISTGTATILSGQRRLLLWSEVVRILQLSNDQVQFLVNTRQLVAIRIAGEERFDSREVERLIDTYVATALRRAEQ